MGAAKSHHDNGKDYVDAPLAPLLGMNELKLRSFYRDLMTEFVATLIFLYIAIATVIGHKKYSGNPCDGGASLLGIAWAFGGTVFVLIYCTFGISGGHMNPAVSLGFFVVRKVSLVRMVGYTLAQCLGAICGTGVVKLFMNQHYNALGGGANLVAPGYSKAAALGAEIIGTFILLYVYFTAMDSKRRARDAHISDLTPLCIGLSVFVVHLATIPITGTSINPARSLGPAVIYNRQHTWDDQWIFWIGPFLGAMLAAAYHQLVLRGIAFKAFISLGTTSEFGQVDS